MSHLYMGIKYISMLHVYFHKFNNMWIIAAVKNQFNEI